VTSPTSRFLRSLAATLVTLAGLSLLGALWFRDLSGPALLDAMQGSVYLFIGIGLFGSSRFTLFLAIGVCLASIGWSSSQTDSPDNLQQLRMLLDIAVVLCSCWVLWQLRRPSNR
jgi:hypothetical protein